MAEALKANIACVSLPRKEVAALGGCDWKRMERVTSCQWKRCSVDCTATGKKDILSNFKIKGNVIGLHFNLAIKL